MKFKTKSCVAPHPASIPIFSTLIEVPSSRVKDGSKMSDVRHSKPFQIAVLSDSEPATSNKLGVASVILKSLRRCFG